MITPDSPIVGKSQWTADQAIAWLRTVYPMSAGRWNDIVAYVRELERLCNLIGFRFDVLFFQAVHEATDPKTGLPFTSDQFEDHLNPVGLGVFDDGTTAGIHFTNGTDAARAHVAHMWAYVEGTTGDAVSNAYKGYDPRFQNVFDAGFAGTVRTLGDLGNGKWATDPRYAEKIAATANRIFTEELMTELTYGLVPKPVHTDSHLDSANPMIGYSTQPIVIEGVVWHRMIGTLWGTDGWFHAGKAATAYGVGVVSVDGQDDAGRIIEWIDPANGHYYGESSGPVSNPYGDGLKFVQRFGIGRVNPQTVAIEISGNYDTPLDEAARNAIVTLTAYFADQRKIPWDQFPIVPGQDRSFVHWHQEFTIGTGKVCPGQVVMNETSALIERVAGVLKKYQTNGVAPKPPQYATPELPEFFNPAASHPADNKDGELRYHVCRRNFLCFKRTRRLSKPDGKAARSGPMVEAREKIYGEYLTSNGFLLTTDGHYVGQAAFSPGVTIKPR